LKKSLVLTGMMGVGKSTIGRLLAKRLKIKFIDVDKIIERNERKSIKKIFEDNGEKYFRKIEEKITFKIIKKKNAVIALGGGAFINNAIREKVLNTCISIWLKVSLEKLIVRYKRSNRRPLLDKRKLDINVKKIYQTRKNIYRLANFKVNCDNINKTQIVDKILVFYGN
tara:strand:+ start:55 stop:561 length:507 start_codon:yes stop_codon:yes gene_type:complete